MQDKLIRGKLNKTSTTPKPIIRAASILIENGRICVVKQAVTDKRDWALPGGKLEIGEKLSECIIREFAEETGINVQVRELLYVTDRIIPDAYSHIVHMTFLVDRLEGGELPHEWEHKDPYPSSSSDAIRKIKMVPVNELGKYGFSPSFCKLVKDNFPSRGSYQGDFHTFYGE
jgi:ADP-ribose pyrophosphatase YjhB (NUDIX family)